MKARFLHVYVKPNSGVTDAQVEKIMDKALDWFKYDDHIFIAYSNAELSAWKTRLKPIAGKTGFYLVCEIDPRKRVGWMPKSLWDWLRKER